VATPISEQRTAPKTESREPELEATEVAPGVLRIMLPVPFMGLGHVNCYALEDERGIALIDPGVPDGVSLAMLRSRLDDVGLDLDRVHTCVSTHSHIDHYGGITRLRVGRESEVGIVAFENHGHSWWDAFDDYADGSELMLRSSDELDDAARLRVSEELVVTTPWGSPSPSPTPRSFERWASSLSLRDTLRPPEATSPVADGDRIDLGGQEWLVLHTPGHCDDHLCLYSEELGVLFSGDHVLPEITPHVGGRGSYDDPLADFFESLDRVAELPGVLTVLPAHGDPFTDLTGRCREIAEHHRERLARLRQVGGELGEATVEHFMRLLFDEPSHGRLAAAETFAHLEWLRIHDGARRTESAGLAYYEL